MKEKVNSWNVEKQVLKKHRRARNGGKDLRDVNRENNGEYNK